MARIRTIKPELFKHDALFDAEQASGLPLRLAFIGLFTCCDREGRFKWRPRALKLDVLPYDDVDFERVLDALARTGFVQKYEAAGEWLGCIPSFSKHQTVNQREAHSTLPAPTHACIAPEMGSNAPDTDLHVHAHATHDNAHDGSHACTGTARGEGKGKEGDILSETSSDDAPIGAAEQPNPKKARADYSADFEERFWKPYPAKGNSGKHEAWTEWKKLPPAERDAAVAGLPGYGAYIRANPTYTPLHACRYLSKRRFEVYQPQAQADTAQQPATSDETWLKFLTAYARYGSWPTGPMRDRMGPPPDDPATRVPKHLIPEYQRLAAEYERGGVAA